MTDTVIWIDDGSSLPVRYELACLILLGVAFVGCLLVLLVYHATGRHRRSVYSITVKRVWCDALLLAGEMIAIKVGLGDRAFVNGKPTLIFQHCHATGPLPVAMRLGSALWFALFMWDTVAAIRTPFVVRNTIATRLSYHAIVLVCMVAAIVLPTYPADGGEYHAGTEWGANEVSICGLVAHPDPGISPYYLTIASLPSVCVVLLSSFLLVKARRSLASGCRRTMVKRNQHLVRLTFQIGAWAIYYAVGVVLFTVRTLVVDVGDDYIFDGATESAKWLLVSIAYDSLRGLVLDPLLLVTDLGILDGYIGMADAEMTPGETAWYRIKKVFVETFRCESVSIKCFKSAILDGGSEEFQLQQSAREDVLMCVMQGVIQSTRASAASVPLPGGESGDVSAVPDQEGTAAPRPSLNEVAQAASERGMSGDVGIRITADGHNLTDQFTSSNNSQVGSLSNDSHSTSQRRNTSRRDSRSLRESFNVAMSASNSSNPEILGAQSLELKTAWEGSEFSEFCPLMFYWIRQQIGISPEDYIASIESEDHTIPEMAERFTEGRSNSFFYFTWDRRFMVKTCTYDDYESICETVWNYAMHLEEYPESLLNRIVGCYQLKVDAWVEEPIYIIVLLNLIWSPSDSKPALHCYFDLKGSYTDRQGLKDPDRIEELKRIDSTGYKSQLKDVDLTNIELRPRLSPENCDKLLAQLDEDVEWLRINDIMDYSLLLAVALPDDVKGGDEPASNDTRFASQFKGGIEATIQGGRRAVLYIGIIDISQKYDGMKQCEQCLKTKILLKDPNGISCCPVDQFAERYKSRMREYFTPQSTDLPLTASVQAYLQKPPLEQVDSPRGSSGDGVEIELRTLDSIDRHASGHLTPVLESEDGEEQVEVFGEGLVLGPKGSGEEESEVVLEIEEGNQLQERMEEQM